MIAFIRGKVIVAHENYAILDVDGLGFRVFLRPELRKEIRPGERAEFFVHEYLREDGREFYGFRNINELEFFWSLISISGIGPKAAQNVLSLGTVGEIKKAINAGSVEFLTRVPGIGGKTAQKIILELKGKISFEGRGEGAHREAIDALVNLGYREEEARAAVRAVSADIQDTESIIRAALKSAGKK